MTRKEAQKEALIMIDEHIATEGENAIALMVPQPGKNSWTWKEVRESTINDTPLEGLIDPLFEGIIDCNFIDSMLAYDKLMQEHKKGE